MFQSSAQSTSHAVASPDSSLGNATTTPQSLASPLSVIIPSPPLAQSSIIASTPPSSPIRDVVYEPHAGREGATFNVEFDIDLPEDKNCRLELAFGHVRVKPLQFASLTDYKHRLSTIVPPFANTKSLVKRVPLYVYILDGYERLLDIWHFGDFTYLQQAGNVIESPYHHRQAFYNAAAKTSATPLSTPPPPTKVQHLLSGNTPEAKNSPMNEYPFPTCEFPEEPPVSPEGSSPKYEIDITMSPGSQAFHGYSPWPMFPYMPMPWSLRPSSTLKDPPVVPSTSSSVPSPCGGQHKDIMISLLKDAKLEIEGDLASMMRNWTPHELTNCRRLVQFWRRQEGNVIHSSFSALNHEDRTPNAIIVSCIWWQARNEYYITSVDCVALLEALIAVRFTVEEKNRIRRNLEGFKPLTAGKNSQDSDELFRLIMGFSNPKPRNIEKNVKVFPWKNLAAALHKIVLKYKDISTRDEKGTDKNIEKIEKTNSSSNNNKNNNSNNKNNNNPTLGVNACTVNGTNNLTLNAEEAVPTSSQTLASDVVLASHDPASYSAAVCRQIVPSQRVTEISDKATVAFPQDALFQQTIMAHQTASGSADEEDPSKTRASSAENRVETANELVMIDETQAAQDNRLKTSAKRNARKAGLKDLPESRRRRRRPSSTSINSSTSSSSIISPSSSEPLISSPTIPDVNCEAAQFIQQHTFYSANAFHDRMMSTSVENNQMTTLHQHQNQVAFLYHTSAMHCNEFDHEHSNCCCCGVDHHNTAPLNMPIHTNPPNFYQHHFESDKFFHHPQEMNFYDPYPSPLSHTGEPPTTPKGPVLIMKQHPRQQPIVNNQQHHPAIEREYFYF